LDKINKNTNPKELRLIFTRYLFPPTTKRVLYNTDPEVNLEIRNQTVESLNKYKDCTCNALSDKIECLNSEWDIERFVEANAALMIVITTYLGMKHCKAWFFLSSVIAMFLMTHAFQGWCPPVPLLRKLGVRTNEEIYNEKTALKMLRGDFDIKNKREIEEILKAIEKQ